MEQNQSNKSKSSFWIGGKHTVESALNNHKRKVIRFVLDIKQKNSNIINNRKIKIEYVNSIFFKKIFNNEIPHQGYAALIEKIEEKNLKFYLDNNKIFNVIALDGISDPRNVGAIIRTSVAFGFDALLINKKDFNAKSYLLYKTASGATENIFIFEVSNIQNEIKLLKNHNFWVVGMDMKAQQSIYEYKTELKNVIVFGSESCGMKRKIMSNCDSICKIPMSGKIESLNVSNAVAATLSILNIKKK